MAGVDRQDDALIIRDVMRRLGFRTNALIVNDALIALVAGAGSSPGVVVISGTGAIAYGVSHHGVAARAGGWGPTLGDEGSGYWIGRRALAAVMRDVDGRGPQTDLTRLVLRHLSLERPEELVAEVYHQPQARRTIASLGTVVDGAREDGDPVAIDIMANAADELALAAASVIARLDMRGEQFPILLAGGMLRESVWLSAELRRRMAEVAPRASVGPLTHEPAIGAVRLAIAEAQGGVRVPPYVDSYRSTPQ
jgi:N-acetylglucosamine kinase-like BadF-type ATPase